MDSLYKTLIDQLVVSGKRLLTKTGNVADIGVLKEYLTEEDLRIERELVTLIHGTYPDHHIFAEEEHDQYKDNEDVWVIDPISGASSFIAGIPHYACVISHLKNGEPVFAAVYDPSVQELFVAEKGKGTTLNGSPIHVSSDSKKVVYNLSKKQEGTIAGDKGWDIVHHFSAYRNPASFAVSYCWTAAGRYDGFLSLTKDVFPEFAGKLILEEAGGVFTSFDGSLDISAEDREFIGGNQATHAVLLSLTQSL